MTILSKLLPKDPTGLDKDKVLLGKTQTTQRFAGVPLLEESNCPKSWRAGKIAANNILSDRCPSSNMACLLMEHWGSFNDVTSCSCNCIGQRSFVLLLLDFGLLDPTAAEAQRFEQIQHLLFNCDKRLSHRSTGFLNISCFVL